MADAELNGGEYFLPEEFLSDDFFAESDEESPKTSIMGTSPQSTLCGLGNLSFMSNGSPSGPSQAPSPPSTPLPPPRDDALDLLYAAVGQVERLNLNDENPNKNHRNTMANFYPNQELIKQQAARIYEMKRQQYANAVWEWQRQIRANAVNSLRLPPSEWPPLPSQQAQQPGPAVFLNGCGRRQSNGTGVFLPRRVGAPTEPKKQACSTFLLPARVVQRPRMPGCYVLDVNEALMGQRNLKRNLHHHRRHQAVALGTTSEICLPQEWTY